MPRSWRTPSFLLLLVLAAAAGWLPGGSFLPADSSPAVSADFNHLAHIAALGENQSCPVCHADRNRPRTRATSTPCATCHGEMSARSGEGQTQPVGLGRPATLQAPLAGPEGKSW